MSSPAQNVSPDPRRTRTRHSRSSPTARTEWLSSSESSSSSALWHSGRLSVIVVTGPSRWKRSFPETDGVPMGAGDVEEDMGISLVGATCVNRPYANRSVYASTLKAMSYGAVHRLLPQGDAVYRTLQAVGDAWSWLILRDVLLYDAGRFSDLQRRTGAARATLVARLQQLVDSGLLEHRDGRYLPTASGHDFLACLLCAGRWGAAWYPSGEDPSPPIHLTCGAPVAAILRCSACGQVVEAREVTWSAHVALESPAAASRQRAPRRELLERGGPSPLARTLAVIGDWWTSLVIREAFYGTRRFHDFERRTGAAPNILAARLKHLVHEGVLDRAPSREYHLTAKGLDLYHVPLAMMGWGDRWSTPSRAVTLTHVSCGKRLRPRLSCGVCAGDVTRDTLRV